MSSSVPPPLVEHSIVIRKKDPDEHQRRLDRLREALECGAYPATAAAYAGMSGSTLQRWVKEGRRLREIAEAVEQDPADEREPSPSELELIWIADMVDMAEASAEVGLVRALHETAQVETEVVRHQDGDVQVETIRGGLNAEGIRAAAFLLERRFKDRWAKRTESTGAGGGPVAVEDLTAKKDAVMRALDKVRERLDAKELGDGAVDVIEVTPDRD